MLLVGDSFTSPALLEHEENISYVVPDSFLFTPASHQ